MNLLKNDKLRENLRGWGKERIKRKYNWAVTADNILNAYKKGIENKKLTCK